MNRLYKTHNIKIVRYIVELFLNGLKKKTNTFLSCCAWNSFLWHYMYQTLKNKKRHVHFTPYVFLKFSFAINKNILSVSLWFETNYTIKIEIV